MARPKTASDLEILEAAQLVMVQRGFEGFTLAAVAREVGISRSAIIQRFESTRALMITLTARMVEQFGEALDSLPVSRSGEGLVELAVFIGGLIKGRKRFSVFMQNFQADFEDPDLAALEQQRGQILADAVSARLPPVAIDHDSAVQAFMAHLGGSLMKWGTSPGEDAAGYLRERTVAWLTLAGVPISLASCESIREEPAGAHAG